MKSPITGANMTLQQRWSTRSFRNEEFEVFEQYYVDEESGDEFSTTVQDELVTQQVYNQYRSRHHIPFPDEIREIREQYGLSAAKMAEVLDLGINTYRLYENGDIPSLAHAKLIRLAKAPSNFRAFVEEKQEIFSEKIFQRLMLRIQGLAGDKGTPEIVAYIWNHHMEANNFTGFVKPNFEKVANYVLFFAEHANPLKTRMNKLLFYCDFANFKQRGHAISGCNYRAIQMGPVPSHFHELFGILESEGYIRIEDELFDHGGIGERFYPARSFNPDLFNEEELELMKNITEHFKDVRTRKIIELSHQEKAWIDNHEERELIDYQKYAFELSNLFSE